VAQTEQHLHAAYADMPWIKPELTGTGATLNILPEKVPTPNKHVTEKLLGAIAFIEGESKNNNSNNVHGTAFLFKNGEDGVKLVTAAHVLNAINPETLTITGNDGEQIAAAESEAHYYKPESGDVDVSADSYEDIGFVQLQNPKKYAGRALTGRNTETNPIQPGEALFTSNFQGFYHPVGDPATYTVIAATSSNENNGGLAQGFMDVIGDVMPKQDEDSIQGGASGSELVDTEGRVVGVNTSATKKPEERCGVGIPASGITALETYKDGNTVNLSVSAKAPGADECNTGLLRSSARSVNSDGSFTPKNNDYVSTHIVHFVS
jgi:hypothetical protein